MLGCICRCCWCCLCLKSKEKFIGWTGEFFCVFKQLFCATHSLDSERLGDDGKKNTTRWKYMHEPRKWKRKMDFNWKSQYTILLFFLSSSSSSFQKQHTNHLFYHVYNIIKRLILFFFLFWYVKFSLSRFSNNDNDNELKRTKNFFCIRINIIGHDKKKSKFVREISTRGPSLVLWGE